MSSDIPNGAHVEIIDPNCFGTFLTPRKVLINGVDVGLVAHEGVAIKVGSQNEVTEVTLTLLPSRVTIRGPEPREPDQMRARYLERLRARAR